MRKVKGLYHKHIPPRTIDGKYYGDRWEPVQFEEGYFHQWGIESTELETGALNDTVAIVELANGQVVTVQPRHLVFLSKETLPSVSMPHGPRCCR